MSTKMAILTILALIATMFVCSGEASKVLVLGSGGLIGTGLTTWLKDNNYSVEEVKNRRHVDLRIPGALNYLDASNISFVFFLACEVGGSKYIDGTNTQLEIVESNVRIYQTVFDWIKLNRKPFIFTSSYLQSQSTSYGSIKRLGEQWINSLPPSLSQNNEGGKSARLWNVYGPERLGPRSHVLGDWINSCITTKTIQSMTNGLEYRQFLHVNDTARALGLMMENYDSLDSITDISSGIWWQMTDIATLIANNSPRNCIYKFSAKSAVTRLKVDPNLETPFHHRYWNPLNIINITDGVKGMFKYYMSIHPQTHDEL